MNSIPLPRKEKTTQLIWTGFILSFFLIQAAIWTVAILITSRDSSHAVVAGYDEQALRWDDLQAQQRASDALGWISTLEIARTGDVRGNRTICLEMTDRDKAPVENAKVEVRAFHRGKAAEVQNLEFTEIEPGIYSTQVQVRNEGNWQFSGVAVVNEHVLQIEKRTFLSLLKAH